MIRLGVKGDVPKSTVDKGSNLWFITVMNQKLDIVTTYFNFQFIFIFI